jgi:hypothetical protein
LLAAFGNFISGIIFEENALRLIKAPGCPGALTTVSYIII